MSKVIIPILIDDTYPIKTNIDSKWIFTDIIYQGDNIIYVACVDSNCEYVAKIINIDNMDVGFNCYTAVDKARNELVISKLMSEAGIGPTIYDMSMNNNEAIIVMD